MCNLWGKNSKRETEGDKLPASITTHTHQHPCSPPLGVFLPSPPSITGPERQQWPCMTTNSGSVSVKCVKSYRLSLFQFSMKSKPDDSPIPRPPAPSIIFLSSSIKPQLSSIVTLPSNTTSDLPSHTPLSNQQEKETKTSR